MIDEVARDLVSRWQASRDSAARNRIVVEFKPLVLKAVRRARVAREWCDDAIQEGNIGLCKAIDSYNGRSAFAKHATVVVWQAVAQFVFRNHLIRRASDSIPGRRAWFRIGRAIRELRSAGILEPSDEQVAAHLGVSVEHVAAIAPVRFVEPDGQHDVALQTPEDLLLDASENNATRRRVDLALLLLSEPQRRVVSRVYLDDDDATFADVGRENGVSRESARQAHDKALRNLRRILEEAA